MLVVASLIWIVFATVFGVVTRNVAVRWAQRRGWTAISMPMSYHVILITVYLVVVQAAWILLYVWLVHN